MPAGDPPGGVCTTEHRSAPTSAKRWRIAFGWDPGCWHDAIERYSGSFADTLAREIDAWRLHSGTWKDASEAELQGMVDACSWIWRAITVLAAAKGGLIEVRPCFLPCSRGLGQQCNLDADDVSAIRDSFRTSRPKTALDRNAKLSTWVDDPSQADLYLSRLMRTKGRGLPDIMLDDADAKSMVIGEQTVAAAAEYISRRGAGRDRVHECQCSTARTKTP